MIRKSLTTILLLALTILIAMLAVANRHPVKLSIDPFSSETPAFATTAPLFLIVLVSLIAGAVVGGSAAWLRQRKWRRAARRNEAELRKLRAEADALRQRVGAGEVADGLPAARAPLAYQRSPAA
jgi:uncharacterized integral membrane protein